jgi:hypothetical protein
MKKLRVVQMLGVAVFAGAGLAVSGVPTRVTKPAATPAPVVAKQPAILAAVKPAAAVQPVVHPITRVVAVLRSVGAVQTANVVRVVAGPVAGGSTTLLKSSGPVVNVVPGMAIRPPFRPPPRSAYRPPARPPYGPPF